MWSTVTAMPPVESSCANERLKWMRVLVLVILNDAAFTDRGWKNQTRWGRMTVQHGRPIACTVFREELYQGAYLFRHLLYLRLPQ